MTEFDEPAELDAKAISQITVIEDAFHERGIAIGYTADFLYQKGHLLVRDEYLVDVIAIVGREEEAEASRATAEPGGPIQRVIRGVVLLSLAGTRFDGDDDDDEDRGVLAALNAIDGILGAGAASPNYVLTVSVVHACPANDPEEVPAGIEPYPGVCTRDDGTGIRIYIADTGLVPGADAEHSWLAGVTGDADALPAPGQIGPYTGHGTFVSGVVRCMAPGAAIHVGAVFDTAGSALESDAVPKLSAALTLGADIFHLSIATATRKALPLLAFDKWRQHVAEHKGVVCIVAAGNSGSYKPRWPAAFPDMVSVGALGADSRDRAQFTNHGGWVDCYARGRDLINAYASGHYVCHDHPYVGDPRTFYGMARWSGTSFSAPIVTGLVAARMHRTGENGREAAAALLALARSAAIPGVGAVLLPCLDANGAPGCAATCCCHGCGCGCASR